MPEANTGIETPAAAEQPKAAAQPVADEAAELRAQLAKVLKHKEELEADLHKTRVKREEEAKKAKEAGDFARLLEMERERAAALEAQLKQYEPDAIIGRAAKERAAQAVEAAKADPNLPDYMKDAIAAARSPLDAAEVLAKFRAQAKQPLPTAPAVGAAPANTGGAKGLHDLTPAEILSLKPTELDSMLGAKKNGASAWTNLFFGK